jgi:hypothetical protein
MLVADLHQKPPPRNTASGGGATCSVVAEVCEDVIAAVGNDGAVAAAGRNPCTDLDADLALRVAPLHRDILALAVPREPLVQRHRLYRRLVTYFYLRFSAPSVLEASRNGPIPWRFLMSRL